MRIVSLTLAAALCIAGSASLAHDYKAGTLSIGHPWARATPPGATVAAGYLTLTNTGSESDALLSASLDGVSKVEIHESAVENGVATMRPVEGGVAIAPGATVTLQPGGIHVMFMGLAGPLTEGETVAGTLTFERAGTIPVEFAVGPIGGTMDDHSME